MLTSHRVVLLAVAMFIVCGGHGGDADRRHGTGRDVDEVAARGFGSVVICG